MQSEVAECGESLGQKLDLLLLLVLPVASDEALQEVTSFLCISVS